MTRPAWIKLGVAIVAIAAIALIVGKRPTAVTLSADQRRAIVANTFDDTLSVVDIAEKRLVKTISLGSTKQRSLLQRGEELFYDARFSHEGWMSCHSCHTDGHSNFTRNDNLDDASRECSATEPVNSPVSRY